jgi:hypothetical protein
MQKLSHYKEISVINRLWISGYLIIFPIYLLNVFYPYNTFLFRPGDIYGDTFKHVCEFASFSNPYHGFIPQDRIYNPFVYLTGIICNKSYSFVQLIFFSTYILCYLVLLKELVKEKVSNLPGFIMQSFKPVNRSTSLPYILFSLLVITSYPFLITINRMNYEMYGFCFFILFLFVSSNWRYFFLGLFLSLKINYFFFLLLPLFLGGIDKKIIGAIFFAVALNLFSLCFFHSHFEDSVLTFARNIRLFDDFYTIQKYQIFSHSIWNYISLPYSWCIFFKKSNCLDILVFMKYVHILFALVGSLPLFYLFIYRKIISIDKIYIILTTFFLLFSRTSPCYRAIFFIPSFIFLLRKRKLSKLDWIIFVLIILFIFPKNISLSLFFKSLPEEIHLSVFIDPILLIIIYICSFKNLLLNLRKNNVKSKNL